MSTIGRKADTSGEHHNSVAIDCNSRGLKFPKIKAGEAQFWEPPVGRDASGIALGLDRLVMLATGAARIDQVQWAPLGGC